MTQTYGPLLETLDLTYPQYLVMLVLWKTDDLSVKEIGQQLKLDSGTLSPLLKKMQAKGLLQKVRLDSDERSVAVGLTAQGQALKKQAEKVPLVMACNLNLKEKDFVELRDKVQALSAQLEKLNA